MPDDAEDLSTSRIRRRDDIILELRHERDESLGRCRRLQQRIEDLFGPEAADVDPPRSNAGRD